MERFPCRRLVLCAFCLSIAVVAGCGRASTLTRADEISMASEPAGAAVHAGGKLIGVTPLTVHLQEVFPVVYPAEQQDSYGKILIKKEGCKDHTVRVTNEMIRKGVNVKLDCGQGDLARPQAGIPTAPPPSVKERILRLNELREQGLITEEEYREIRKKILGDL